MAMTYSLDQAIDPGSSYEHINMHVTASSLSDPAPSNIYLCRGKLEIPRRGKHITRPRIESILERSIAQFPATLISGRAGTGKTTIASMFVSRKPGASWYSVESSDSEWSIFARYFSELIAGGEVHYPETFSEGTVARFLMNGLAHNPMGTTADPRLLVMDDIHHIFDAEWFNDFFKLLLYSLPPDTHLIMLCRSKPPSPLWRLRSKQMLNVIDEKVIAFNPRETEELFNAAGLSPQISLDAHRRCYGHISKLNQIAEDASGRTS